MTEAANITKLPAAARMPVAVDVNNPISLYLDTGVFDQLQRVAKLMVSSGLAPSHLKGDGKIADAFLVTAQAFRWGMDPFAVAQHTFVYQNKLGYEGKLIAAVVNSRGRLKFPLNYRYEGAGDNRKVIVSGTIEGETTPREIEGTAKEWRTNNDASPPPPTPTSAAAAEGARVGPPPRAGIDPWRSLRRRRNSAAEHWAGSCCRYHPRSPRDIGCGACGRS